ncbi:MAG: alpha/beta fold hydrolase [Nitrospinae bacterium]|nr:alpha/beta fold hydrolase [Nitrospinota bacterium]
MSVDLARLKSHYPFTPLRFDRGGVGMSYVDEGHADAPPILFVHGNPTWSFYWRRMIRNLSPTHRCVAPDHVGCGLSDKPQEYDYTLRRRIDDLEALVTSLGLKDIVLAVHDWGGAIGMGYAVRHPENIRALMIFNTAAFRSPKIPLRIAACRLPVVGEWMVRGGNAFVGAAVHLKFATESRTLFADPVVKEGYLAPYDTWDNRVAVQRFVEDIPMNAGHPSWTTLVDIEQRLKAFEQTPSLVIWGRKDWCFDTWHYREWLARLKNVQAHLLPDAGHWVVDDAPETVDELTAGFLAALPESA